MQPTILLAFLSTAILNSFVLAAPAGMNSRAEEPASTLQTRQYYDGPCSHTDCGVNRINCRTISLCCVAYPSFSKPEGCTCSPL
ncbi:hypothetical protein F5Y09DRAFT_313679 [Xylaria sp. FL1042]|nr:hypothetical protein F5Y09DRAFT_313679 [Xylaria sp. FL1042]